MFEEFGIFYRGIVLGLMIAAPVGPIGLLCIRRTLQKGLLIGLATGLGAACADTVFGAVAALGVSAILNFMKTITTRRSACWAGCCCCRARFIRGATGRNRRKAASPCCAA